MPTNFEQVETKQPFIPHVGEQPLKALPDNSIYAKGDKIGTQGDIRLLENDPTRVVKTYEFTTNESFVALINRFSDIKRYYPDYRDRYPNIMFPNEVYEYKAKSAFVSEGRFADMVLDRAEGDLSQLVSEEKLSDQDLKDILIGTADSIEQLLSMGITHGDIKLANFLYRREQGRLHVYITDFSNSRVLPFKQDETGASSQGAFISLAKKDRNHYYNELLTLLRGNTNEKLEDTEIISSRYGVVITQLLEEFKNGSGDLMHYPVFASKVNDLFIENNQ